MTIESKKSPRGFSGDLMKMATTRTWWMLFMSGVVSCATNTGGLDGANRLNLNAFVTDTVKVEFRTENFFKFPFEDTYMWGGVLFGPGKTHPKVFTASFSLWYGKQKAFIPVSAFSDLADPRTISLKNVKGSAFTISLKGSETGEAYVADFFFERNVLKRRRVYHIEFPDEVWSETVFSQIQDDGR